MGFRFVGDTINSDDMYNNVDYLDKHHVCKLIVFIPLRSGVTYAEN